MIDTSWVSARQQQRAAAMRPEFRAIFNRFPAPEFDIAIMGSALRDFDTAGDIDVLVLAGVDFRQLCRDLGVGYKGKWTNPVTGVTVRRINFPVEGASKPVQIIQNSNVVRFEDHPSCVLLRDGTRLKDGVYFEKAAAS